MKIDPEMEKFLGQLLDGDSLKILKKVVENQGMFNEEDYVRDKI